MHPCNGLAMEPTSIQDSDETATYLFEETASGDVIVTTPEGRTFILETDEDAYRREQVLAERLTQMLRPSIKRANRAIPIEPAQMSGETLYTPQQVARKWELDVSTVRRIFLDELGVIKIGKENRRDGKRSYVTLRIPGSVADRVLRDKTKRR